MCLVISGISNKHSKQTNLHFFTLCVIELDTFQVLDITNLTSYYMCKPGHPSIFFTSYSV